ncbi:hypothetical protein ACFX2C_031297 [Malus domestica]
MIKNLAQFLIVHSLIFHLYSIIVPNLLTSTSYVGSETALSQIVQLVEAPQLARALVQKLADQSQSFLFQVVIVASLTWLGWFIPGEFGLFVENWMPKGMDKFELALQFGISVSAVACPCALGLATPTAVMVATGKGASQVFLSRVEMYSKRLLR